MAEFPVTVSSFNSAKFRIELTVSRIVKWSNKVVWVDDKSGEIGLIQ